MLSVLLQKKGADQRDGGARAVIPRNSEQHTPVKWLCVSDAPTRRSIHRLEEQHMLHHAIVFIVIAPVAAVFEFGGIASSAAGIAQILFVLFLILALAAFFVGRRK